MKHNIIIILAGTLLLLLTACATIGERPLPSDATTVPSGETAALTDDIGEATKDTTTPAIENTTASEGDGTADTSVNVSDSTEYTPPEHIGLFFDNIETVFAFLSADGDQESLTDHTEASRDFAANVIDKGLPAPVRGGSVIPLRQKEGYPPISFDVEEAFSLPWLWYFLENDKGGNYFLKITLLPEGLSTDSAASLQRQLAPNYPNVDNIADHPNYTQIVEGKITLADGKVSALIKEKKDDPRIEIFFAYDDLLITVRAEPSFLTEAWLAALDFDRIRP